MIFSRTPLRISFVGGGTDLPSFYTQENGAVISTTIDKYIYLAAHSWFKHKEFLLKYSASELCTSVDEIKHNIFRECFKSIGISGGIEISSLADVPAGSGLGSSSAFTVGLLNTLYSYKGIQIGKERLANEASEIEILKLGEPIGKQDHYSAAYGGFNLIEFFKDESVKVTPLRLKKSVLEEIQENTMIFFTENARNARNILYHQKRNIEEKKNFSSMKKLLDLVWEMKDMLDSSDIGNFGKILHKGWELKKTFSDNISSPLINSYYSIALKNGASGGKILGAGGGGFLLIYCEKNRQEAVRKALLGLTELKCRFTDSGSTIIYKSD